jgi:uncharacterized spore protein YtfJ
VETRTSTLSYVTEAVQTVARSIQDGLSARTVYGDPVSANGVTVIPVAKVSFGFGAGGGGGSGTGPATHGNGEMPLAEGAIGSGEGGGGGGGGGGAVQPLGFIEITGEGARWVPVEPSRAETALRALTLAVVLAPIGGRRGFLARLFLVLAGQAALGALFRPKLPPMPPAFRMRNAEAEVS